MLKEVPNKTNWKEKKDFLKKCSKEELIEICLVEAQHYEFVEKRLKERLYESFEAQKVKDYKIRFYITICGIIFFITLLLMGLF